MKTTAITPVDLAASVESFAGRSEVLAADRRHRERWPAVVVRAVGDLAGIAELGLPLLAPGGVLIAWKGADARAEMAAAGAAIALLGGSPPVAVAADRRLGADDHVLVTTTKVNPTPDGYPRDPADRRRRPL